jgi:hypothetical protein
MWAANVQRDEKTQYTKNGKVFPLHAIKVCVYGGIALPIFNLDISWRVRFSTGRSPLVRTE